MDLRKLYDGITDEIAQALHYLENVERINSLKTAAEVQAACEGGRDRYRNDPRFHAKVQVLVSRIMARVSAADQRK